MIDRDPQVGDRFYYTPGSPTQGSRCERTVEALSADGGFVFWTGGGDAGTIPRAYWYQRATLVPLRPKVADHWGYLCDISGFTGLSGGETAARDTHRRHPLLTLARIVNGRVCDEFGQPFEVAADNA